MESKVFSQEKLIGTADLKIGDIDMGHVYGDFFPAEHYYKYVQPAVWKFWSSSKPNYGKWNSLQLNVQLDNGCFLFAEGGFTFEDSPEPKYEPKRVNIVGIDRYIIDDYFLPIEPRPFVEEPWESISIEQKIGFEHELRKELGISNDGKSLLAFFKSNSDKHILVDFEVSAVCHDQRNDDVLFRTKKRGIDKEFAVVHLTWRGSREGTGYPTVKFFTN